MYKKIRFNELVVVHEYEPIVTNTPDWQQIARDRFRFLRRIDNLKIILDPVLDFNHRCRILANQTRTRIIDLMGFNLKSGFVVKELAICDGYTFSSFVFKPNVLFAHLTTSEQRRVKFVEKKDHIKYSDGFLPYSKLKEVLIRYTNNVNFVFISGHYKEKVLSEFIPATIIDLEKDSKCPKLVPRNHCIFHNITNGKSLCAVENVLTIHNFLNQVLKSNDN